MDQQKLNDIIADSEVIMEYIPNYVLLKYVLYEALERVIKELPQQGQISSSARSILILSKIRTLLHFLKHLLPLYSNLSRDIISRGKQFILSRWASSHDYYRVLRSIDEFPVTFTEVHGFYDPMYDIGRAIIMLSGPPGTKLTKWPFNSTPIGMLQASKHKYKKEVRPRYKQAVTEEIVRYIMRELKPSSMTVGVSGNKVVAKTNFYRCTFITDVNFYLDRGVDFLPLEPLKLQFYPLEIAQNAALVSSIFEAVKEKFQRIHESLEIVSTRAVDTRFYILHSIICDIISTRTATIMMSQAAVYKASSQAAAFQKNTTFYKQSPSSHSIQLQDALHELAVPSFHYSIEKSKNRLLQPCLAVIFRLTVWSPSLVAKVYELGGCMLDDIEKFYPYIDPKTLISYSIDEDSALSSVKSLALGIGKGSNQNIAHILTLYRQGKRNDNYAVFLFRPVYLFPFGIIQLLSDDRTNHRCGPGHQEYIPVEKIPYYSADNHNASIRSQAGADLFRTIVGFHSQLSAHTATVLVDLYQYLKTTLDSSSLVVDATRDGMYAEISSIEIILDSDLGLAVSITDTGTRGLTFSLLIKSVDITETAQRIFSAAIYTYKDSIPNYMSDFVAYFFLIVDLAAGNTEPYFSKLTCNSLQARLVNNRYIALEGINLQEIFTTPATEDSKANYVVKLRKALTKLNYILRICRFTIEIPGTQYSLFGSEIKAFKVAGSDCTSSFNSSLFMSLDNISESLNYYHGGYFIPTPTPCAHVAVAMWDKNVTFYNDFVAQSMNLKSPITDMTIQKDAECCVFVALVYSLPDIISPFGILNRSVDTAWTDSQVKFIPISSAYLKYIKCNIAYESDFLATYAFLNTTVTTCRVSGSAMCLSRLYGVITHIDSLLWHRALERLLLGYNPTVIIDNSKSCDDCKQFRQFVQTIGASDAAPQEHSFTMQLYSLLLSRAVSRSLLPNKLQIVHRVLPTSDSGLCEKDIGCLFPPTKQCKVCNCGLKNPECIKVIKHVELHLLTYNTSAEEGLICDDTTFDRSICIYAGPASYSLISNALLTIAPTLRSLSLSKEMLENLPEQIYLQHSEPVLWEQSTAQQSRAKEVDYREFTRKDLVTFLINMRATRPELLKFDVLPLISFVLDHDVIPTKVDFSSCRIDHYNTFLKIMTMHQDYAMKKSLRRCIYSFKLPGQKVPLIPLLPSRGLSVRPPYSSSSESDGNAPGQRQRDALPASYTLTSQLKRQAGFWLDDNPNAQSVLQDPFHISKKLYLEYEYSLKEDTEAILVFTATGITHLTTQHFYQLDRRFDRSTTRNIDQRYLLSCIKTHKIEYPGGYLNPEQLVPLGTEAEQKRLKEQFMDLMLGQIYENARIIGNVLRMVYLPPASVEERDLEVVRTFRTTDPRHLKLVTPDSEFIVTTTIEPYAALPKRIEIQKEILEKSNLQLVAAKYQPDQSTGMTTEVKPGTSVIAVSELLAYKRLLVSMARSNESIQNYVGLLHITTRMACKAHKSFIASRAQSYYMLFDLNPPSIYVQFTSGDSSNKTFFDPDLSFPATMHIWLQSYGNEGASTFAPPYMRYKLAFDAPPFKYVKKHPDNTCSTYIIRYYNNEVLPIIFLGSLNKRYNEYFAPLYNLNAIPSTSVNNQRKILANITIVQSAQQFMATITEQAKQELVNILQMGDMEISRIKALATRNNVPFTLVQNNGCAKSSIITVYNHLREFLLNQTRSSTYSNTVVIKLYKLLIDIFCGKTNAFQRFRRSEPLPRIRDSIKKITSISSIPRYWLSELGYMDWDKYVAKYFGNRYTGSNLHLCSIHSIVNLSTMNAVIYRRSLLQFLQYTFDVFMDKPINKDIEARHTKPYCINRENMSLRATESVLVSTISIPSDGPGAFSASAHMNNIERIRAPLFTLRLPYIASLQDPGIGTEFLSKCIISARKNVMYPYAAQGMPNGGSQASQGHANNVTRLPLPICVIKDSREQATEKKLLSYHRAIRYGDYIIVTSPLGVVSGWKT